MLRCNVRLQGCQSCTAHTGHGQMTFSNPPPPKKKKKTPLTDGHSRSVLHILSQKQAPLRGPYIFWTPSV